jgi:hypothetical protein
MMHNHRRTYDNMRTRNECSMLTILLHIAICLYKQFGVYEYMKRELLRRSEVADQRQLQLREEQQQHHHRQPLSSPSSSSSSSSSGGSHSRLRTHRQPLGFLLPSR